MDILSRGLNSLGIFDEAIKESCEKYIAELLLFNSKYGLIAAKSSNEKEEIITRHIFDSLAVWKMFLNNGISNSLKIADAGSGAGLPGIPLAIALSENQFVLIEKKRRRALFLENAKAVLHLNNVSIMECEIETAAKNTGAFDIVTCRGFSEINAEILKVFFSMLNENGKIIFYKGKREKAEAELAASFDIHKGNFDIVPYNVPFLDGERNAVVLHFAK